MTGTVFDIKEFAVFDGPGIRTTVFMKGCPLRCTWCHNPEGLSAKPELMVSTGACTHCGACKAVCQKAVCDACGQCIPYCKAGLRKIVGTQWTAQALAKELTKGKTLFDQSGGGVTFSGGEPTMQWPFVKETIDLLDGIHTAIETSGYCTEEVFRSVMETLDFIMLDVKQTDPQVHKTFCGVDNAPILRHAQLLAMGDTPYVLRVPLIPVVNDTKTHLKAVAQLCVGAKACLGVELLPYHKTAGAKYSMVARKYTPGFDVDAELNVAMDIFAGLGIDAKIL